MFVTVYKDIIFIEGTPKVKKDIKTVDVELMGLGAQLRNLRDVKERLYTLVKESGGNCLSDFKYGQKQRIFAFDDVAFYGSGLICQLEDETYNKYLHKDDEE